MINQERMTTEFLDLLRIDSLSGQERQMADILTVKLKAFGFEVYEDQAGEAIGGNSGNLIANFMGDPTIQPIVLMTHMDTVSPGLGKYPIIKEGIVYSDGTTVLGSDNIAAVAIVLEAIRVIQEQRIVHGDIQIVFSIAEEAILLGAIHMDYSKIYARKGIVIDAVGDPGHVVVQAPSQNLIDIVVAGTAAHAGVEPEKGVNALSITAQAICRMRLGRIDDETTANIGVIEGGTATNTICETVKMKAEVRSHNQAKLVGQTEHMKQCFEEAALQYGGKVSFRSHLQYSSYHIQDQGMIGLLEKATRAAALPLQLISTNGGSDANVLNEHGITTVNLCLGMNKIHSTTENIAISDMEKTARLLVQIITNV